jgi:hypothetical protein
MLMLAAQLLHVATDQNLDLSVRYPAVCGALAACAARPDKHIRDRLRIAGALHNTVAVSHSGDVLRVILPLLAEALSFDALSSLAGVVAGHSRATEARLAVFAARSASSAGVADVSALEATADDALSAAKEGHAAWSARVAAMKIALEMITNVCTSDADVSDSLAGKAMHAAIVESGLVAMVMC